MKKELVVSIIIGTIVVIGAAIFADYKIKNSTSVNQSLNINTNQIEKAQDLNFSYTVDPSTFTITIDRNGVKHLASNPLPAMKVTNLQQSANKISWTYPEKHIDVSIEKENNYLNVKITSTTKDANSFEFPNVSAQDYTLPMDEGKYIPSDDPMWKKFLNGYKDTTLEMFSMPFFALNNKDYTIMYIIDNPYNNNISFNNNPNIEFNINHDFPTINPNKTYGFRIYVTPNNPVEIAKTYKDYVVSKGDFKTLAQKAAENPNVNKLIGAPQIYLWDSNVIEPDNINWKLMRTKLNPALKNWIIEVLQKLGGEQGQITAIKSLGTEDFTDKYDQNTIVSGLTAVCMSRDLYNPKIFTNRTPEINTLLDKGINNLTETQLIQLNKLLLKSEMGDILAPVNQWSDSGTTDIINDMRNSGIKKAWIGLNNWTYAYMKPEMVTDAVNSGYLIAPYDSYTTIQEPGHIKWDTAGFANKSLYYDATIENKDGQKVGGFKGQGRILNPTLSMLSVKERVNKVLSNIPNFNSWFIDCDAAGQIYNDYSPNHTTTKREDLNARLKRMAYIANEKHMVIGSEGGCDYASQVIDFAQGIESPPFSWDDKKDMRNKNSKYFVGTYYSPYGGVPHVFGTQVPVKQEFKDIFMDPAYTIPLYRLVYNNSVVTTDHWLWGTFKAKGEVKNKLLHDILYNTAPLYHLDQYHWAKEKNTIIQNDKIFEPFSTLVSNEEMTNFEILSKNRLVQMTEYGDNVKVITNFSNDSVNVMGHTIPAKSLIIFEGDKVINYSPDVPADLQ